MQVEAATERDRVLSILWLWAVAGMRRGDVWELTVIGTQNGMSGMIQGLVIGCR